MKAFFWKYMATRCIACMYFAERHKSIPRHLKRLTLDILNSFDEFFGYTAIIVFLFLSYIRCPQDAGCFLVAYALALSGLKSRMLAGLNANINTWTNYKTDYEEDEDVMDLLKANRHTHPELKKAYERGLKKSAFFDERLNKMKEAKQNPVWLQLGLLELICAIVGTLFWGFGSSEPWFV